MMCRADELPLSALPMVNYRQFAMELLLNLIWMAIALGAFGALIAKPPSHRAQAWLALGCAVALLFPVVSATDDLHPVQAVFEDSGKRARIAVAHPTLSGSHPQVLPAGLALWLCFPVLTVFRQIFAEPASAIIARPLMPDQGRAPPF